MVSKKVLIITSHFPPDRHVGARRPAKLAKYLPIYGWMPVILTVPINEYNYEPDESLLEDLPNDLKIYRVSGGAAKNRKEDVFVQKPEKLSSKILSKIGSKAFPGYSIRWILNSFREGIRIVKKEQINLIFSTEPHSEPRVVALFLSIYTGKKFVCDFRDPTRGILYRHLFFEEIVMLILLKLALWRANAVVSISNVLRQRLIEVGCSLNRNKYVTIYNGFDEEDYSDVQHSFNEKAFTIMYVGSWGGQRNPKFFLDAVEDLLLRNKGLQGKIKIIFVGWVKINNERDKQVELWLKERISKGILSTTVELRGYLPYTQALNEMQKADVLLACNSERDIRKGCLESKFFEYLRAGKPILGLGAKGCDLDYLLSDLHAGILVPPTKTEAISKAIHSMYKDYCNGLQTGAKYNNIKQFERKQIAKRIANLFNAIMSGQKNLKECGW